MRRGFRSLIVASMLFAVSPFTSAEESFISCPVEQVDSQVTTPLPNGWWTTPVRGPLLGTEIRNIGGQTTLVCNYRGIGASIPVMRKLPAGFTSCVAAQGGFDCSAQARSQQSPPGKAVTPATQVRGKTQVSTAPATVKSPQAQAVSQPRAKTQVPTRTPTTKSTEHTPVTQARANVQLPRPTARPTAIMEHSFPSGTRLAVLWHCDGNQCVRSRLDHSEVEECRSLAQEAGRVRSFSSPNKLLNGAELADCNSPLVQQFEVHACSGADDLRQNSTLNMAWKVEGRAFFDSTRGYPIFADPIPSNTCSISRVGQPLLAMIPLARLELLHFRFEGGRRSAFDQVDDWDMAQLTVQALVREPGGRETLVRLVDVRGTPFRRFVDRGEYEVERSW